MGQPTSQRLLSLARDDIGSALGLTLETVSRTLSNMQGHGVIGINRCRLRVLHMTALRQIAHGAR